MSAGTPEPKYCAACDRKLTGDAAFCTECGTPWVTPEAKTDIQSSPNGKTAVAEQMAATTPTAVEQPPDPKPRASGRRLALVVAGAIVILLVVVAGSLALTGVFASRDEPDQIIGESTSADSAEGITEEAEPPAPLETAAANPNEGLPITEPARGSTERTALMDAARTRTGTDTQFLVWQLYVQGDSAIGDIQESRGTSAPGNRWLVTWERSGSSWEATYHVPFLDAERTALLASSLYLTEELADTILFVVPFTAPPQVKDAARIAARLDQPEKVETPSRVPEGWRHEYRTADYGQAGGMPGFEHWHFLDFTDGSRTITLFSGSPEGAFDALNEAPLPVNWGAGNTAYLYQDDLYGHAVVGLGDPFEYAGQEYSGHLYADSDSPQLRAALSAMALSMGRVEP